MANEYNKLEGSWFININEIEEKTIKRRLTRHKRLQRVGASYSNRNDYNFYTMKEVDKCCRFILGHDQCREVAWIY